MSRRRAEAGDGADPVPGAREPAAGAERSALFGVRDDDALAHRAPVGGSCSYETGTAVAPILAKSFS